MHFWQVIYHRIIVYLGRNDILHAGRRNVVLKANKQIVHLLACHWFLVAINDMHYLSKEKMHEELDFSPSILLKGRASVDYTPLLYLEALQN